jgi:hypothetical protein
MASAEADALQRLESRVMCSIMRLFHLSKTRKSGSESASTETSKSQKVIF